MNLHLSQMAVSTAEPAGYSGPGKWYTWSPAEHLAPKWSVEKDSLVLESKGSKNNIGKWAIELEGLCSETWYRIGVSYKTENVACPWDSVIGVLTWFDEDHQARRQEYLEETGEKHGWRRIERLVQMPANANTLGIDLYFRWAASGRVLYRDVSVEPSQAPKPRKVKLAVVNYMPSGGKSWEENFAQFEPYLEEAGKQGANMVCLGEVIDSIGTGVCNLKAASPLHGQKIQVLGDYAVKYGYYLICSLNIEEDGVLYNMAVLIDRQGEIAGTFRKVHLPFPEVLAGIMPGDDFPVFETDFGKVGMQICYDNWFSESARALKLNGAEIIFLPIWSDGRWNHTAWDVVSRARAIDNSVFLVASSYSMRSLIIDPTGKILQDGNGVAGVLIQEVDLNATMHNYEFSMGRNLAAKERRPSKYGIIPTSPLQLHKESSQE
jgi:predicted amidohydrolase